MIKVLAVITIENDPSPIEIPHIQHLMDNETKFRSYDIEIKEILPE